MEIWIGIVVFWIACGGFAGYIASEKARSGAVWFMIGLLFGPLAVIAAAGVPMVRTHLSTPAAHAGGLEDLQTAMTRSQNGAERA